MGHSHKSLKSMALEKLLHICTGDMPKKVHKYIVHSDKNKTIKKG